MKCSGCKVFGFGFRFQGVGCKVLGPGLYLGWESTPLRFRMGV